MVYALAGWNAEVGDWDSEIVMNDANPFNGEFTAQVPGGEVARIATDYVPCLPSKPYRGFAWLYATAVTVNDKVHVYIEWYTSAKASISTSDIKADGPLSQASTWEEYEAVVESPANACFYKVKVAVDTGDGSANVDIGGAGAEPTRIAFLAYRDSTPQTISSGGAGAKVQFDAESYDFSGAYDASANYRFTAPVSGIFDFNVMLQLFPSSSFNGSSTSALYLYVNGAVFSMIDHRALYSGEAYRMLQGSMSIPLSRGDYVEVYVYHDDGQNLYVQPITSSAYRSTFNGAHR